MRSDEMWDRVLKVIPVKRVGCEESGSVARGPFSFWRRVPVAHAPDGARTSLFSFAEEPSAFPVALAIDLLLLPPGVSGEGDVTVCTMCAPHIADPASRRIGALDRHWSGSCGHGIRLSGTCHDPAVHAWIVCLDALLGAANVYAERPGALCRILLPHRP